MGKPLPRRNFITRTLLAISSAMALPYAGFSRNGQEVLIDDEAGSDGILSVKPMGFQWETADPFLFCVHHEDDFPAGNEEMGPARTHFKGRQIGDDFIIKDGFRMYHGKKVPGFPGHPHRGFETITVVRKGVVDHTDSMGAAGRYGNGDVQWMTAGKGVQHAEMFPLVHTDKKNPLELFQIWLNLPQKSKMVDPHFTMIWRESVPVVKVKDAGGRATMIEVFAGAIGKDRAPAPPPNSWAADKQNEVAVLNIKMAPGATWTLPKASMGINRTLYFYEGEKLDINGRMIKRYHAVEVKPDFTTTVTAGADGGSLLLLQGRPIKETVIQYGPFVMNSKAEINQAFEDFHKTKFGGWPWPRTDYVHPRERTRFARHADGKIELKDS